MRSTDRPTPHSAIQNPSWAMDFMHPFLHRITLLYKIAKYFWLFTESDFATFVIPNTVFGVCSAIAGYPVVSTSTTSGAVLRRIPAVIFFNWSNLLVFDLANQRLWEAVEEDKLNKPWRPIPSGKISRSEVRQAMQMVIPLVLALNHYFLNVGAETACILTLTWVYNDLKASDDGWIQRNFIIAISFGVYNWSSLKVAIGAGGLSSTAEITRVGLYWIALMSGVILTTMHIQDLKDTVGDKERGRHTSPLVLGEKVARWTLVIPITCWGPICMHYWKLSWIMNVPVTALGLYVAWRCISYRGNTEDRKTWQLWCGWTALLSLMPLQI
ncbi:hypothetical protein BCIN_02g00250 [Botrytis cinerea B05.10]|uniref:UbiA prenyltransferase n=3 Tax=Botryotinia fuckeliana TaxID=40559 RepID=A0A384J7X8_BOTFB|nr:hypothetical protein BCIN_02g00250 [Botrytis cinerea B05.10]ATZ46633.1 hypothetical protein BCIN_02g00250 [Botrytis cinerea B05.10]EMR84906.1 hypothetical protein BcDW1_6520 [Botrytis cinerea BcDW1]CCD48294.1 hypothetical protein BofuT4_P106780.1 [Botrytis cinerea T4]